MRRLPIFFLLDVSESMIGAPLNALEDGVTRIVASLRKDPSALETVYISVIAFAGKAEVISPLVDLLSFYTPKLPIGGGTALGSALEVLMHDIDTKVNKQTATTKGDWKPIVFLITDGQPTDKTEAVIEKWRKSYASKVTLVAITLGNAADFDILRQLTSNVLMYEGSRDEDYKSFIDWISHSISTQSQKVELGTESSIDLSKTAKQLTIINENKVMTTEPNNVVLTGRCQTTGKPYLIKYSREGALRSLEKFMEYSLEGCFPVAEAYFEWSSKANETAHVDANALKGAPGCPYCGNLVAIALCGNCQKIMCINGEGDATCPWCHAQNHFVLGDGNSSFEIERGQG